MLDDILTDLARTSSDRPSRTRVPIMIRSHPIPLHAVVCTILISLLLSLLGPQQRPSSLVLLSLLQ
jgi:hypothetical protein